MLRIAADWGYLVAVPKIRMVREPKKLATYMPEEHFAAIYRACEAARKPSELPIQPPDCWRALLTTAFMTGWRIGEILALRRDDLDLENGTAITRHDDNKGKRDELVPLHPLVVDHLRAIACFEPVVFPWYHDRRSLWTEFYRIQKAAGIHLPCSGKHEHTDGCHYYGFHDCRRAFASLNAENMSAEALQKLMRHQCYTTTQRYINLAGKLKPVVDKLHVPEVLRRAT